MKQLNSNFTNIEQSKRLLELGLPADSADCGITDDIMYGGREILLEPYSEWCKGYESISVPCWSVGRLIEILKLCVTNKNELHEIFEELEMCIDETTVLTQAFKEYSEVLTFQNLRNKYDT